MKGKIPKKYYWLKLPENFFESDNALFLESQPNGDKYIVFYLKLCCKALQGNAILGRYVGECVLKYDDVSLSKLTRTDIDTVRVAFALFLKLGLVKETNAGELFIPQVLEMTGSETRQAEYQRKIRAKSKGVTLLQNVDKKSNNVYPDVNNVYPDVNNVQKCYTELELEKEKEKELEVELELERETTENKPTTILENFFDESGIGKIKDSLQARNLDLNYVLFVDKGLHKRQFKNRNFETLPETEKKSLLYSALTKWSDWEKLYKEKGMEGLQELAGLVDESLDIPESAMNF